MRRRLFDLLAGLSARRPWLVVAAAALLTVAAAAAAGGLRMETRVLDLLPSDDPAALEFDDIVRHYSSASQIMVGIEGDDREEMIAFADEMKERLDEAVFTGDDGEPRPYVEHARVRLDKELFERHGMMLTEARDLRNLDGVFRDLDMGPLLAAYNDFLEMEYIEDVGAVTEREKEDRAIDGLKGVITWLEGLETVDEGEAALDQAAERAAKRLTVGETYLFSEDDSMLLAMITPAVSLDRMEQAIEGTAGLRELLHEIQRGHPELRVRMAGLPALSLDEMEVGFEDMKWSSLVSLLLVLALFVASFRIWSSPLWAVLTLVLGVIWTSGFIALSVGRLNLFTLMFAVILFGLGIDFSIHLTAAYTTARSEGRGIAESMREMFRRAGAGVVTGALTTAAAFLALALTGLEAFVELGVVLGAGIALTLLASLTVLPSLLCLHERASRRLRGGRERRPGTVRLAFPFLAGAGAWIRRRPWPVVAVFALLSGGAIWVSLGAEFEPDMLEIEPPEMPSVTLHRDILERYELHPDYAMLTTNDLERTRSIVKRLKKNRLVGRVDALSELVPSRKQQKRRARIIEPIRERMRRLLEPGVALGLPGGAVLDELPGYLVEERVPEAERAQLLEELDRFQMNVQEIGQLAFTSMKERLHRVCERLSGGADPEESRILALKKRLAARDELAREMASYQSAYVPRLAERLERMCDTSTVTPRTLPDHVADRYLSDGGENLITIYAAVDLWHSEKMDLFIEAMDRVSERVTGSVLLVNRLIELIGRQGLLATLLALGTVVVFLLIDFRRLGYALLGTVPLLVGFAWMIGLFVLAGREFDVVNVMAIPLILGIGIDDSVHVLHAVRREGARALPEILRHTGRALVLTSLTTGIAFGSIAFASHRGMAGMGQLLVLGVLFCLLASLFLLPALARIFLDRQRSKKTDKEVQS